MSNTSRILLALVGLLLLSIPAVAQLDDLPNLSQYETSDGSLSFYYPTEWAIFIDEVQGLTLLSDVSILNKDEDGNSAYSDYETLVSIQLAPTAYLDFLYGVTGETSAERLESIVVELSDDLEILQAFPADDVLQGVVYQQGDDFIGTLIVWDISDDVTGIAMMLTAPDNFERADLLTQYILLSMEFNTTIEALIEQFGGDQ